MEIQGNILVIGETQSFGTSNFLKRELVVKTQEQYPQTILIEFLQDKASIIDGYEVGQSVKIGINLRGREWTNPQGETKYFNSIVGWRIEKISSEQPAAPEFEPAPENNANNVEDDSPF